MFLSEKRPNPVQMFREGFSQQQETTRSSLLWTTGQRRTARPSLDSITLTASRPDFVLVFGKRDKFSGCRGHGWMACSDLFKVGCRGLAQQLLRWVLGLSASETLSLSSWSNSLQLVLNFRPGPTFQQWPQLLEHSPKLLELISGYCRSTGLFLASFGRFFLVTPMVETGM